MISVSRTNPTDEDKSERILFGSVEECSSINKR
jgi:hypothetical protein